MIDKKHRIPQVAAAALLLGGTGTNTGCGDSDSGGLPGGSTTGVDVSSARVDAIAKAVCSLYKDCNASKFASYYDSISECARSYASDFDTSGTTLTTTQKKCLDAILDYYACYADTSCTEDAEVTCKDYGAKRDALCPTQGTTTTSGKRGFRIPAP